MAVRKRPHGTMRQPVTLFYEVEKEHKDRWKAIADHLEITPSALFDLMIDNLKLDERGYPVWLPEKPVRDGELPIEAA